MNVHDSGKVENGNLYFYLHEKMQISNIKAKDPIVGGVNANTIGCKKAHPSLDHANEN
jgi:hypothetical protein